MKCDTLQHQEVSKDFISFRLNRLNYREKYLNQIGSAYLDKENNDFEDEATIYPYAEPIFNYLQNRELAVQPLFQDFMKTDGEINPRMRYILINWLVQIHYNYKLQPETLYLCVALLDRYLLVSLLRFYAYF